MQMPNLTCFTYFFTFLFLNIAYDSVVQLRARGTILYKQRQLFFFEERYDFGTKKELRTSIPVEDFFFF